MKKTSVSYDYKGVLEETIGDEHGVSLAKLLAYQDRVSEGHAFLMRQREAGEIGFFDLPFETEAAREIASKAMEKGRGMGACLVLGIGGSSLGGKSLRDAIKTPFYNELSAERRGGKPRLYFAENIDPESFGQLLEPDGLLTPEKTLVVVISKSGGTAETMSQFLIVVNWLKQTLGADTASHVVAITDPERGILREIAEREGYETFSIPSNVGGRFSVLSPVGLFPAAVIGIDVVALLEGARAMAKRCETPDLRENPAYLNAVIHYIYDVERKKPLSILMPYADSLLSLADWYRQLYAESLGKRVDTRGREVYTGPTPIRALGATDQHSQLQLYMEGPFDKVITFIRVASPRRDVTIPYPFSHETPLGYLSNHSLGQLIGFEQLATATALRHNKRPTITLKVEEVNEYALGQLLYFYELQVALQGQLYGINPFDQPGVEFGKKLTYGLMGREGYEDYARDVDA